jgi:hypothetical protein
MAGANIKSKDNYVYFLYSEQQRAERARVERTMSRTFNPGTVVVNGRRENFTEISKSPTNRYPDCKVVAQGIKSKMVYTPISIT